MRRALRAAALSFLVATSGCATALAPSPALAREEVAVSAVFVDALAPYGTWLQVPPYGLVWRPDPAVVGTDFLPYVTNGYWVATDVGWTWVSNWGWGWAPFHYGRWYLHPAYGWVWVPDTTWGPAWVDWRFGGGWVGWAPLPPGWTLGVGLGFFPGWCFVPVNVFVTPVFVEYRVPPARAPEVFAVTRTVPRVLRQGTAAWPAGPAPRVVEREARQPVPVAHVEPPPPGRVTAAPVVSSGGEVAPRPAAPRALTPPPVSVPAPRAEPLSPPPAPAPEAAAPPSGASAAPSAAPAAPEAVAPPSSAAAQPSAAPAAPQEEALAPAAPPPAAPPVRVEAAPSPPPPAPAPPAQAAPPPPSAPPAGVTAAPPSPGALAPPPSREGHG